MTLYIASMILAGVVVALALALLHRANEAMTQRAVSGYTARRTPQGGIGAQGVSEYPIAYRTPQKPAIGVEGHSGGAWRSYGYEVPTKTRGTQTVRHYRRNRLGPGAGSIGAVEITNTTPHREPNAGADVIVPAMQALITAAIGALVVGVVALTAGRGDALRLVGVAFVGILGAAWLWRLGVVDSLLSVVERVTQTDIDGDGDIGEEPAHVMLENPGAARDASAKIAGEHAGAIRTAELLSFLTRCSVVGTSEGKLGIGTSPQARAKYAALRDTLILLGIGQWRDENRRAAGWLLTMTPEQAAPLISRHVKELRSE